MHIQEWVLVIVVAVAMVGGCGVGRLNIGTGRSSVKGRKLEIGYFDRTGASITRTGASISRTGA